MNGARACSYSRCKVYATTTVAPPRALASAPATSSTSELRAHSCSRLAASTTLRICSLPPSLFCGDVERERGSFSLVQSPQGFHDHTHVQEDTTCIHRGCTPYAADVSSLSVANAGVILRALRGEIQGTEENRVGAGGYGAAGCTNKDAAVAEAGGWYVLRSFDPRLYEDVLDVLSSSPRGRSVLSSSQRGRSVLSLSLRGRSILVSARTLSPRLHEDVVSSSPRGRLREDLLSSCMLMYASTSRPRVCECHFCMYLGYRLMYKVY
ncbi:hypothetical protein BDZ97DRAFT_1844024, partial [Flammula alnicola]